MSFVWEAAGHGIGALPLLVTQALLCGLLLAIAWGTGRGLIGRALGRVTGELPALTPAASLAVWSVMGLVTLGTTGFGLGLVGGLSPWSLGAVALVGCTLASPAFPRPRRPRVTTVIATIIGSIALAPVLLLTLYPPNLTDDLLYHLPMTRSLAETGRLSFLEGLRYPVFPQLQETLWSPLLRTLGVRGVEALVLSQGVIVGAAVFAAARLLTVRAATPETGRVAGVFAVALWVGCPATVLYGTAAFVDVPLAAFVAVAGWCALRAGTVSEGEMGWSGWPTLAGLAAGAGAATKYHGMVFAGLLALPWLLRAVRCRRLRPLLLYGLTALTVAAPWYGRNLAATGNPVFPFFQESFGVFAWNGAPYSDPQRVLSARSEEGYGIATASIPEDTTAELRTPAGVLARRAAEAVRRDLPDLPRLIRELTLTGRRSHGPPPLDAWLLVLVAAYPFARGLTPRERRGPLWPLILTVVYLAFWFITFRDPRYLLPVVALALPTLVVPIVTAAHQRRSGHPVGVALFALLLAAPGLLYGAYRVASLGATPRTEAATERFLDTRVAGHDLLAEVVEHRRPGDTVYLLGRPRLRYFLPGRVLGDHLGFHPFGRLTPNLQDPDALAATLRRWDVDLLVVFPPLRPPPLDGAAGLHQLHRDPRGVILRVGEPGSE